MWPLFGLLWVVLAGLVSINGWQQGRSVVGWFVLGVVISPLVAGLLLRALERGGSFNLQLEEPLMPPARRFEPEASYGEIPYKVNATGSIDAVLAGKVVRFFDVDEFLAAVATPINPRFRQLSHK